MCLNSLGRVLVAVAVFVVFLQTGCERAASVQLESWSPDRTVVARMITEGTGLDHPDLRLVIQRGSERWELYHRERVDYAYCYQDAAWSTDSQRVAMYVVNCADTSKTLVGFDVVRLRPLSNEESARLFRCYLRAAYSIPIKTDPLDWVAGYEGNQAWRKSPGTINKVTVDMAECPE